jgi:dienelactone hydrolase
MNRVVISAQAQSGGVILLNGDQMIASRCDVGRLLLCFLLLGTEALAATFQLPNPEGPYGVGFWESSLKTDRVDDLADRPNSQRELLLQVWYPSEKGGSSRSYAAPEVINALALQFGLPKDFGDSVVTHASPMARAQTGSFALMVFSHGLSWPGILYQSLVEDMASRGYVIVVVTHPHGASITRYPDGRIVDMSRWPELKDPKQEDDLLARQAANWAADLKDVITLCFKWNTPDPTNPVAGHLDLGRVVVMGHSLGGTAAGQALEDSRVTAGVAFEGKARRIDGDRQHISKPFMHLIGGYNRLELEGSQYHVNDAGVLYEVIINGATHTSFSDLIFIYKHFAAANWIQRHRYEVESERIIQITRDYVAAFLDRVLYGRSSTLLQPVSYAARVDRPLTSGYPEVELHVTVR